MKAVLLAAGKGTRLKPITDNIPKVMIPINGKPILEHHLRQLAQSEIREVYINLHYLSEKIREYFKDGKKWGLDIQYSHEPEILGTAGAVKNLEKELGKDPFLVVYGDNFLEINYGHFIRYSEKKGGIGAVAVFKKEDVRGSGILDIGYDQRIINFVEKPKLEEIFSHWVNGGVFYFKSQIFDFIEKKYSDFGYDVFPRLLKNGMKLYAYKLKNEVYPIDSIDLLDQLIKRNKEKAVDYHTDSF